MLKLKVIACDVLNREISYLGSRSGCFIDTVFLHQGLHSTPQKLNTALREEIEKANQGFPYTCFGTDLNYDYIVLAYGLCCNGIVGLSSSKVPLVIPRGHDCITLLLGSKQRYREYFDGQPGTYWFSAGWIERGGQPCEERQKAAYREYGDKYGAENAEYLMDTEQNWLKEYKNAVFISWSCLGDSQYHREFTAKSAAYFHWSFSELNGDASLLDRLLNGIFNPEEVLVLPPGKKVIQSFDDGIIKIE